MNKRMLVELILLILILVSALFFRSSFLLAKETEREVGEMYNEVTELLLVAENYIEYIDVIERYSKMYDVPPEVILAVIKIESDFDVNANSGTSYGLMQINDVHLKHLEDKMEILDVNKNIEFGTSILAELNKESDDLHFVLNSYNMGQYGYKDYVRETGKVSRAYSRKAIEYINQLKN